MTVEASYVPGGWVAVAGPSSWLLVDAAPGAELIRQCWPLVARGAPVEDVLDVLVAGGLRSMPAFALVHTADVERRALARGAARVVVVGKDGDEVTVSGGARAWADHEFADDVELVLLTGEDAETSGVELPLTAGVTTAASVRVRMSEAPAVVAEPEPPVADEPEPAAEPEPPVLAERAEPEPPPVTAFVEPEPPADAGDEPSFDFLFGATQRPAELPREGSPVGPGSAPVGAPTWEQTAGWATLPPPAAPLEEPPAPPVPPAQEPSAQEPDGRPADGPPAAGGLIDSLPWESPAPPGPEPVVVDEPPLDVSRTVDRSALAAAAADAGSNEAVPSGPTVLAGRCPNGHLSPPHAAACRICRQPMPEQAGFEIPRPPLGVLRLSTGDVVTLDRGVVFGRAPEAPADAAERPHAVRLVSPENDISRTHAEVVLDGWHVYVRDLGSTNGTVVTLPSQPPLRVRPHDMQLLEDGSVVTLADEVSFTFEVTA